MFKNESLEISERKEVFEKKLSYKEESWHIPETNQTFDK